MQNEQYESSNFLKSSQIEEDLRQFLFFASTDYKKKNNHDNGTNMHDLFNSLKTELSMNKDLSFDVISLITNANDGINGWLSTETEISENKYPVKDFKLIEKFNPGLEYNSRFSGVIAFRKELLEAAISGGYLTKVKEYNLFSHLACLPLSFKSILEFCPNEVLAYGKKNILTNIDNLSKHKFLSASESKEWKKTFENQIANYPEFPSKVQKNFFLTFLDNITDKFSKKTESKKPTFK